VVEPEAAGEDLPPEAEVDPVPQEDHLRGEVAPRQDPRPLPAVVSPVLAAAGLPLRVARAAPAANRETSTRDKVVPAINRETSTKAKAGLAINKVTLIRGKTGPVISRVISTRARAVQALSRAISIKVKVERAAHQVACRVERHRDIRPVGALLQGTLPERPPA